MFRVLVAVERRLGMEEPDVIENRQAAAVYLFVAVPFDIQTNTARRASNSGRSGRGSASG